MNIPKGDIKIADIRAEKFEIIRYQSNKIFLVLFRCIKTQNILYFAHSWHTRGATEIDTIVLKIYPELFKKQIPIKQNIFGKSKKTLFIYDIHYIFFKIFLKPDPDKTQILIQLIKLLCGGLNQVPNNINNNNNIEQDENDVDEENEIEEEVDIQEVEMEEEVDNEGDEEGDEEEEGLLEILSTKDRYVLGITNNQKIHLINYGIKGIISGNLKDTESDGIFWEKIEFSIQLNNQIFFHKYLTKHLNEQTTKKEKKRKIEFAMFSIFMILMSCGLTLKEFYQTVSDKGFKVYFKKDRSKKNNLDKNNFESFNDFHTYLNLNQTVPVDKMLFIKDKLRLSDSKYIKLRNSLGLQGILPPINDIKKKRDESNKSSFVYEQNSPSTTKLVCEKNLNLGKVISKVVHTNFASLGLTLNDPKNYESLPAGPLMQKFGHDGSKSDRVGSYNIFSINALNLKGINPNHVKDQHPLHIYLGPENVKSIIENNIHILTQYHKIVDDENGVFPLFDFKITNYSKVNQQTNDDDDNDDDDNDNDDNDDPNICISKKQRLNDDSNQNSTTVTHIQTRSAVSQKYSNLSTQLPHKEPHHDHHEDIVPQTQRIKVDFYLGLDISTYHKIL